MRDSGGPGTDDVNGSGPDSWRVLEGHGSGGEPRPGTSPPPNTRIPFRRLLRGNVGALAGTSFLNDTASEMAYPLLPLFLVGVLGAGPGFLGIVEGIAESTASLAKLGGGFLSDRVGRRKVLVIWGYGVAALARPLLALATAPWHVLAVRFTDRVGKGIRSGPRDALLVDSVPSDRKGAAFGLHRAADHAGSVLGPLLAAGILLLTPENLRLLFAATAVPGALTVWVLARKVREVSPWVADEDPPRAAAGREDARPGSERPGVVEDLSPLADRTPGPPRESSRGPDDSGSPASLGALGPAFPRYLLVVLLFTLGNASDAFLLLRAQELGVSAPALPLLWGVLHLSKMAWNVPGGMLADRFRPLPMILVGWLVYAGVYAGFAVASAPIHIWGLFVCYGLFYGLTESPEKALVADLSPGKLRGRAFGAFHFASGLGALPASLIFGALWEWRGAPSAFLVGAGFALVSALLLPFSLIGPRPAATE